MKKCNDCNKWDSFAKPDELARYCATHKKQGMINVYRKFCNEKDCKKQAISGYFKCIKHGGGKRCNERGDLVLILNRTLLILFQKSITLNICATMIKKKMNFIIRS